MAEKNPFSHGKTSGQFLAGHQKYGRQPPPPPNPFQQYQYGANLNPQGNPSAIPPPAPYGGPTQFPQHNPQNVAFTNAYANPDRGRSGSRNRGRRVAEVNGAPVPAPRERRPQFGEGQVNNPQDGQNRRGKGGKGPFWKGKQLNSKEEQLQYIGHCKKWMRDDEPAKLVHMIREAFDPLESIVGSNMLDHDVIEKLLEILTCDNLIKPVQGETMSAQAVFSKVINSALIISTSNIQEYSNELFENFHQEMHPVTRTKDFTKLKNVYKLLEHLLSVHQSESAVLWPLIRLLHTNLNFGGFVCELPDGLPEDITELFTRCKKIQDISKERKKKRDENRHLDDESADYGCLYKEMSILPSKSEITKPDHTKLRKLVQYGQYRSAVEYLDIHFKLLREDMIRPLRQGIQNFLKDRMENVRKELYMYEHVRIVEMHCDQRQGLLYRISFRTCNVKEQSKIKWDRVQRLKFGTLLCILTCAEENHPSFERPLWAVVANRDEKELTERSQISIRFQEGFQPHFEFNKEYFIVESRQVYYEAYFHTLTVLKEMTPETIPLKSIILGLTKECEHPSYLTFSSQYIFENIFPESPLIPVLGHWPYKSDVLDPSQYRALKLALTKEVALIQGPPGTGKTYVGAHALRVILSTRQHMIKNIPKKVAPPAMEDMSEQLHALYELNMNGAPTPQFPIPDPLLYNSICENPIIIVTYTNHALDQFLEYILPFEDNIIRIGTRSENEDLKEKTLPKIAKNVFSKTNVPQNEKQLRYKTFDLQRELKSKQGVIKQASQQLSSDSLTKEDFAKYLDTCQCNSLFGADKDGFQQVKKQGEDIVDLWLRQHAPAEQRKSSNQGHVQGESKSKKKGKNKKGGNQIETRNRYEGFGYFDDDELIQNVDEKRKEILQDLDLLPPERSPKPSVDISPTSQPPFATSSLDANPFAVVFNEPSAFDYSNIRSTPIYSNVPHHQGNYVRNLSSISQLPFDDAIRSPLSSRPDSPISVVSVSTVDFIDASLPANDLENDDVYLHRDSDDDDAVDVPFQNFYDDLKDFGGLTMEEAKALYYIDTQTGAQVLPDNIITCVDLWSLTHNERKTLHDFLIERRKQECNQILTTISNEYTQILKELQEKQRQLDVYVLKQAAIVGMTTTGAARNSELLKELHPIVIFVEEAAEVLEAHILACLSESVKHIILIGDHQQLRPSNAVYELSTKYNLDISLFERLVNNKVEHVTLEIQHRMRPEISALIKPIYKNLQDYPDVRDYPPVKGVMRNIFFIDHREFEDRLREDSTSHTNKHEAEFIAHFTKYLLKQGYEGSDITILTFYMGQKFKILDWLKNLHISTRIRCTTVDKYQGEENKIIIFSVVRSNHENKIGYCRVDNRVCVALSRAKHGFFIIGNKECLVKAHSETHLWRTVIDKFNENVGPSLPLSCQNHPKNITMVGVPKDFEKVKNGGCDLPCDMRLNCGHQCQQLCHPDGHDEVKCHKDCTRIHEPCKHPCVRSNGRIKKCYEECDGCLFKVSKKLAVCGHVQEMTCSSEPLHSLCTRPCDKFLPCMHPCPSRCGEACENSLCTKLVTIKLFCKHDLTVPCFESQNVLALHCDANCGTVLECGCVCQGTCSGCLHGAKHVPCNRACDNPLICSHPCREKCHRPKVCSPCTRSCINRCPHTKCGLPCGELCVPCIELCGWTCRHHKCTMKCFEPCNRERCNYDCRRKLRCGHPCMGLCGEPCPKVCKVCNPKAECFDVFFGNEDDDDARFLQLEDCGHIFEVSGFDYWMDVQKGGRENTGKVQLPFCPNCKTPIRMNLRYGKIIKEALISVEEVKNKVIIEMRKNIRTNCGEISNKIQQNYLQLHSAQMEISQYLGQCARFSVNCDHRKLYILLDLLKIFADLYDTPEHFWKNCQAHKAFLKCYKVERLLENLTSKSTDKDHLQDLERLSQRCLLSSLFEAIDPIVTDLTDKGQLTHLRNRFVSSLIKQSNTNAQLIHDCELFLANVKIKYKFAPVSEQERIQIARAVDVNRGGWYRCRNGHLYGIGDCGGAVMRATCNECGVSIGGTGHRVDDDNLYAGQDMGGNDLPAWPGQPGFP